MDKYSVSGMSCAACVAHVEKAVKGVDGVNEVNVNLLTNSMTVEGSATAAEIEKAVEDAGYKATLKGGSDESASAKKNNAFDSDELKDRETPKMVRRLILSIVFLLPLMYVSMGHMMLHLPLPKFLDGNHVGIGLTQMIFAIIVMFINKKFFISGIKSSLKLQPNMDTLVAMGSGVSFIYSLVILYSMTYYQSIGNAQKVEELMGQFYFESAAMILTLITVGKTLEAYSKGRTTDAIKGLMELAPKNATLLKDGEEVEILASELKVEDMFLVKPGESIPVDGVIVEGNGAIDESALTGESIPVDKAEGDEVSVGTINKSGVLKCKTIRVGTDTTLSKIIQMVSDASATKAPIARTADKIAGIFVPVVILIALITIAVWLFIGGSVETSLMHGITVLVISCPCALGLATPVAIMVGNGVGAKNGILYKNAVALEQVGRAEIIALDKTGTVTKGEPFVTDVLPAEVLEEELLKFAGALEKNSEHPLAKAVIAYNEEKKVDIPEVSVFKALSGNGISAKLDNKKVYAGKDKFIESVLSSDKLKKKFADFIEKSQILNLLNEGKTLLYFASEDKIYGALAVSDVIKPESEEAISDLKKMGLHTVLLTGDNEITAKSIAKKSSVDEVVAGVLPEGKEEVIRKLQQSGKVIMVGDGINDAPALTRADVGFAIGAGTDIAIDAADVVLVNSKLSDAVRTVRLSRSVLRNIHENLFWAFIYNIILIPLAAGLYYPLFHITMSPMYGALAMSMSSFCVVMNALRLNLINLDNKKKYLRSSRFEGMKAS